MPAGLSKSQIDKLGLRLVGEGSPTTDDLELLHDLLLDRAGQLDRAETKVRETLGVVPTSRVKSTGTILEKLRRRGGSGLKSLQDLAGMRIVGDSDRREQDELVRQIVTLFSGCERQPKVVDRRAEPMHGYRAVHVVVFPESDPLEIQVRTQWQHEWAEFFEKLADKVGRGIRYGDPPAKWWTSDVRRKSLREYFDTEYKLRTALVEVALSAADMIDAVETLERVAPDEPRLTSYRGKVNDTLVDLRGRLDDIDDVERVVEDLWP